MPTGSKPDRAGRAKCVLPPRLETPQARALEQMLNLRNLKEGYAYILAQVDKGKPAIQAADSFLDRFVERAAEAAPAGIAGQPDLIRAGLIHRCIEVLPFFRVRLAERGVNPRLLENHLRKRLLATLMGISPRDVEVKIRHSAKTPPQFVEQQVGELLPKSCLVQLKL